MRLAAVAHLVVAQSYDLDGAAQDSHISWGMVTSFG
jgi:hypothetical protein